MAFRVGRVSGSALFALARAVRAPPLRAGLSALVRSELGIDAARRCGREARGPVPYSLEPRRARTEHERASLELGVPRPASYRRTALDLTEAYRDRRADPEHVIRRALELSRTLDGPSPGPMLAYTDERAALDARASAERWARGAPLGDLDGVPVAVKEEMDVHGLPTRLGTSFMPDVPALRDAAFVARLRSAGAIVIGHTVMTEYGLSPLGVNANRRMPRNVYASDRLAGGSSTGSAVAVALGLVPLALGTDGGGSVRTPAAYNGVFGLKPTYGRIACTGHGVPGGTSVIHFGPLAASVYELALSTELGSGPDADDRASLAAPPLEKGSLVRALGRGVLGLRLGVPETEWRDAHPGVALRCREALSALERAGALLIPLELPLARHAPAVGYMTIAVEALTALRAVEQEHHRDLGLDLQLFLNGVKGFAPDDYVDAQRLREGIRGELARALAQVDVIVTPSSRNVAPRVTDAEMNAGFIDTLALDAACRYAFLANITGLPAVSAPVGTAEGLPVGLQVLGDAWDEACVLQVAAELERSGATTPKTPARALDLLGG